MRFNQLAWAGLLFYYKSAGDKRYSSVMRDSAFVQRLRTAPAEVSTKEFEEKAILGLINLEHYDLLLGRGLAEQLLSRMVELSDLTAALSGLTLADCDLEDSDTMLAINRLFDELFVEGLWITGVSKLAHLLNEKLFPPLNPDIAQRFGIMSPASDLKPWLKSIQQELLEALDDFRGQRLEGEPDTYLSQKLGYSSEGYTKPLVKFADEYYWLKHIDGLRLPPAWVPEFT